MKSTFTKAGTNSNLPKKNSVPQLRRHQGQIVVESQVFKPHKLLEFQKYHPQLQHLFWKATFEADSGGKTQDKKKPSEYFFWTFTIHL